MYNNLKNKVALVTGASFGIGKATAIAFARQGAKVVVADISEDHETVSQIKQEGGEAVFFRCNVADADEIKSLINKTIELYGRIDFAFNNAGIEGTAASTHDCSKENWDKTLAVNLTGVWLCMKYQIPHMLEQGGGAIVNCASVAGLVGFPNLPAYTASKHAVIGLTKTAALEYARQNIRINAVCPGVIKTPMIDRFTGNNKEAEKQFESMEPVGRLGQPEEVASAVLWLCSSEASFVTGQALAVDGGWVAQ